MNKAAIAITFFILLISITAGATKWQDKVSYEIPPGWSLLDSNETDSLVTKSYLVKESIINSKKQFSNALLQYYTVPSDVTMVHADNLVASHTGEASYILSATDEPNWKTYILTYYEKDEKYIILYRFGMAEGVCFELMLSFPMGENKESDLKVLTLNEEHVKDSQMAGVYCKVTDVQEMVKVFNTFCAKMKLCGKNQYKADVRLVEAPKEAQGYEYIDDNIK
jgi:hypothetical protein